MRVVMTTLVALLVLYFELFNNARYSEPTVIMV